MPGPDTAPERRRSGLSVGTLVLLAVMTAVAEYALWTSAPLQYNLIVHGVSAAALGLSVLVDIWVDRRARAQASQ